MVRKAAPLDVPSVDNLDFAYYFGLGVIRIGGLGGIEGFTLGLSLFGFEGIIL